jgi:peptidyl-tRNA hydrolase, PTH1 family
MDSSYLIVGLGNPGREYARTRHNAGFMVIERVAERWRAQWRIVAKFDARLARTEVEGRKAVLCEPQTFMNASGVTVAAVSGFYKVLSSRLLVIVDDADLPLGELRLRASGSSGGHHGLESIERHLGTREYARLRVGIGRQSSALREITGHVLGRFAAHERDLVEKVLDRAASQAECWLIDGVAKAMNQFNGAVIAPMAKDN